MKKINQIDNENLLGILQEGRVIMRVVWSTYKKIRIGILRAVPWSFMVSRVTTGVVQIVFSYFIYIYFMKGNLNSQFSQYTDGADYMTYIVLGAALNVLAVSTLMNIGRALTSFSDLQACVPA